MDERIVKLMEKYGVDESSATGAVQFTSELLQIAKKIVIETHGDAGKEYAAQLDAAYRYVDDMEDLLDGEEL